MNFKKIQIYEVVTLFAYGITTVLVAARFYIRVIRDQRRGVEEWLILFSLAMYAGLTAVNTIIYQLLLKVLIPKYLEKLITLLELGPWFYISAICCSRIAIILFHIQLTEGFWINKVSRAMLWVLAASWPLYFIVYASGCSIRKRVFSPSCPEYKNSWTFWLSSSGNVATDLLLFIIPFPVILKLTDLNLRLAVSGVYATGFISLVTSVARVVLTTIDAVRRVDTIILQSGIEASMHILVATMPGLSGAFAKSYMFTKTANRTSGPPGVLATTLYPRCRISSSVPIVGMKAVDPNVELGHGPRMEGDGNGSVYCASESTDQIIGKK